jgi:hypothetical protein
MQYSPFMSAGFFAPKLYETVVLPHIYRGLHEVASKKETTWRAQNPGHTLWVSNGNMYLVVLCPARFSDREVLNQAENYMHTGLYT